MNRALSFVMTAALGLTAVQSASADPCGMVPPIRVDGGGAIERIGLQTTYAFHKDGMETMVLHPGFRGNVEEFGMLIPFPSAPSIRKVSDDTFAHLDAALSPPDVRVHLYEPRPRRAMKSGINYGGALDSSAAASVGSRRELAIDEVKVVNQEAVGMYQVAVLAAGSAKALKGWMEDHGFRYPNGMEDTVEEYVAAQWFFVAVKSKVGKKSGVTPRPGMRKAEARLPSGASFDGHVQAMGFRFAVDEPVIPMRLSVFNGPDSHNLVYFFSENPMRIQGLDASFVVRQLPGTQVYDHLTQPLKLNVTGGSESQIPTSYRERIQNLRRPEPHNAVAKSLLASDLYAYRTETYSLAFEEQEKELLRISESFGLRGDKIDALHAQVTERELDVAEESALRDLKDMTLTVIDGNFPQFYLAKNNLTFTHYTMPTEKNTVANYSRQKAGAYLAIPISSGKGLPW